MLCWPLFSVVAHDAVTTAKHVFASARIARHVGRPARRLIRHHLGLGHGVAAHTTARAIWRASVVCVPGIPLVALLGPQAAEKVADWLPTTYRGTATMAGVGGGASVLVQSPDPYSVAAQEQPPVSVPEPACALILGGAAVVTMVTRRFRNRSPDAPTLTNHTYSGGTLEYDHPSMAWQDRPVDHRYGGVVQRHQELSPRVSLPCRPIAGPHPPVRLS